ncbi:MAG: flagellar hook-associated protein FlgK [Limnochordia bacterium]
MSSFVGLEIARRGLTAQLKSMEVAGQNIAHANAPGYSRQVAHHSPTAVGGRGVMGGVEIEGIYRQYDAFLSARARRLTSQQEEAAVRKDVLARLEELFGEPGEATIGTALDDLWTAWGQLATNPGDEAARNTVLYRANTLALALRETADDMRSLQEEQGERVRAAVDEINALAKSLAEVNESIMAVTRSVGAGPPNALLDKRDTLLLQLAELADIQVHERPQGDVQVLVGGRILVDGIRRTDLVLTHDEDGLGLTMAAGGAVGEVGGGLTGALASHNVDLPKYMAALDDLAGMIISEVNALHGQGYTPAGVSGGAFFVGTGAGDMAVAVGVDELAASVGEDGRDGLIAQRIAHLRQGSAGEAQTVGQRYAALVAGLGAETASLIVRHENAQALTRFAHMRRESVSGVSLDEELVDLLRFQQAYAAAARFLTVIDEALEVLVNRTGHVGR